MGRKACVGAASTDSGLVVVGVEGSFEVGDHVGERLLIAEAGWEGPPVDE